MDQNRNVLTNSTNIMNRWKEYFEGLLKLGRDGSDREEASHIVAEECKSGEAAEKKK